MVEAFPFDSAPKYLLRIEIGFTETSSGSKSSYWGTILTAAWRVPKNVPTLRRKWAEQCGIKRAFKATSDTAFSRFVPATHEDTETHRGRDIAMAQPLFNRANVDAVLDPLGCTKMS